MFALAPDVITLNIQEKHSAYRSSPNPVLGYEFKENYRDPHPTLYFGSFPQINSHGQRDIERTRERRDGFKRILVLGDSVVAGIGILDVDDTISRRLERSLQSKHLPVEVLNFGVPGYQTLAESELLATKGVTFKPDLVILVYDDSDFEPQNHDMDYPDPNLSALTRTLFKYSSLFRWVVMKTNVFGIRFIIDPQFRATLHRAVLKDSVENGIQRIQDLSLQHHFEWFVAIWPRFSSHQGRVKNVADFYPSPSDQIARVHTLEGFCQNRHVPYYEAVWTFIEDFNKLSRSEFLDQTYTIGDSCHPNVYGTTLAAQWLEKLLNERGFLKNLGNTKD